MLENHQVNADDIGDRKRLEQYLATVLQCEVLLRDWPNCDQLPVFLTRLYRFFETRIGSTPLLLMSAKRDQESTPGEVAKHLELVRAAFDGVAVYSANRLTAGFRARLVSVGAAFAVAGNQLFIPELATDLRERFRGPRPGKPEKLSPSSQLTLFYCLSEGRLSNLTPTVLMDLLRYSIMTMSRAFNELEAAGLARVERIGREKRLSFCADGPELMNKARELLICPRRRSARVRWTKAPLALPLAGEHALAKLCDLNSPSTPPAYAVTPKKLREFESNGVFTMKDADFEADALLEVWRYDPQILASGGVVDPFSLYAQFREHSDERVSMAVDQLLESRKW